MIVDIPVVKIFTASVSSDHRESLFGTAAVSLPGLLCSAQALEMARALSVCSGPGTSGHFWMIQAIPASLNTLTFYATTHTLSHIIKHVCVSSSLH